MINLINVDSPSGGMSKHSGNDTSWQLSGGMSWQRHELTVAVCKVNRLTASASHAQFVELGYIIIIGIVT